ncbi:MAG: carboxypeptidase regulatory-like domain-containing protein [Candidatus Zixiibacteriota bacterium]|nr:MAG: carboxypeptidase regulatory-like domain-containing protein [candidate division Zixibacteria bacterium]
MRNKIILLAIGLSIIMPYSVEAQSGSISGIITDSLQNPVEYARISVNGTVDAAITDFSGSYLIEDLEPGSYDVSINHSEFNDTIISDVAVEQDSITELNIELSPSCYGFLGGPQCFPGNSTWVPLSITSGNAIGEFNLVIKWPADYLTLISIDPIGYGNFEYFIDYAGPGTVRIHWEAGINSPIPGGTHYVAWLQMLPDTSVNEISFIPVWFGGSQSDNAIYDSAGQAINFDGHLGNSIFYADDVWRAYDPNANGWRADIGDLAIVADRLIYGYIVWSRNGTGDDAIQEISADINSNGFVDIADLLLFIYLAQGINTYGDYPVLRFLSDIDPGERDAFSIGNLDGSPIIGYPGQTVDIPIYAKTDEVIRGIALRIMSDNTQIMESIGAESTSVLSDWNFHVSSEIDYQPGYRGLTALMIAAESEGLNTNGQWSDAIAHFTLRMADSGFSGGENIRLRARANIVDSNYVVYQPVIIEGSIMVEIAACDYIYGDANGDGSFNGLDVIYSVSYFKSQGSPPPTDCYCGTHGFYGANADSNGDCLFNGMDVIYSVAALKGTGPMPVGCPDCPSE